MGEKLGYKAADLRENLEKCLSAPRYDIPSHAARDEGCLTLSGLQRVRKIVSAYVDGRPFSVELVTAVCALVMSLVILAAKYDKSRR